MADIGNIFELVGTHPIAKVLLALILAKALWSVVRWRRCPVMASRRLAEEGADAIERRRQAPWRNSGRFITVMVVGIGCAVYGLNKIAVHGAEAPLALLLLAFGIYLFLTEPVQRQIADAEDRAALSAGKPESEAYALAISMVQGNQLNLLMIDVAGALMLGLSIFALSGVAIPM
ncbi:MAG: hypothetical protein AAGI51_12735 [Pseudomonadota bacterium]